MLYSLVSLFCGVSFSVKLFSERANKHTHERTHNQTHSYGNEILIYQITEGYCLNLCGWKPY